jgi:hypothetical protein
MEYPHLAEQKYAHTGTFPCADFRAPIQKHCLNVCPTDTSRNGAAVNLGKRGGMFAFHIQTISFFDIISSEIWLPSFFGTKGIRAALIGGVIESRLSLLLEGGAIYAPHKACGFGRCSRIAAGRPHKMRPSCRQTPGRSSFPRG